MKTLSCHQPWAELIIQGRKTLELRSWKTYYRGRIAVHAARTVNEEACGAYGLEPAALARGALLGTVELVDIIPLDEPAWEAARREHLALEGYKPGVMGWRLRDPQRLQAPIPAAGHLWLYDTPDQVLAGQVPEVPSGDEEAASAACDPERPFELRIRPQGDGHYLLSLYQRAPRANGGQAPARPLRLAELGGAPLQAVTPAVLEALRAGGYRSTELRAGRAEPFRLPEEAGLRLALLFLVARPITRLTRIEAAMAGLRTMPSEEAYYWFSKCSAGEGAANAQRALRLLLAGD